MEIRKEKLKLENRKLRRKSRNVSEYGRCVSG